MAKPERKKPKKFLRTILIIFFIFVFLFAAWVGISLIGRVDSGVLIPDNTAFRLIISNPIQVLDGILNHESTHDISGIPALAPIIHVMNEIDDNVFFKNKFVRFLARGKIEIAMLPQGKSIVAAYDLGFLTPLMRIMPLIYNFLNIPDLYYVKTINGSRFELRADETVFYIDYYKNLLYITNDLSVMQNRSVRVSPGNIFKNISPLDHDAVLQISPDYIRDLFSEQDPGIEKILSNINFDTMVEAGLLIQPKKLEFNLAAPLSSEKTALSRFLESRSGAPEMADRFPADAQYATILSAGTLEELYQAAVLFGVDLDETLKLADNSSRFLLGLTLDDLLFSWSGKEFAVFGMEGRPHPVFAVQISDENKRQQVFDKAFKSIFINEDLRLNIDGMRMPRIALPEFLQTLLRKWNIFLPSPYYTVYKDFLLASESAEALLSALHAMQRNDVLPKTAAWRNIAGGKTASSAFSVYYSLDLSIPFFLRKNTTLSAFISLYREGLVRLSFDRGLAELSVSLVPGSGNGVTLLAGYPLDIGGRSSNQVFGAGKGADARIFFASGSSAFSIDLSDNSIYEIEGQGNQWIIPADIIKNEAYAWVVSDRGRVTLVNKNMEPEKGFPLLTGLRISAPPQVFNGRLYLCDEGGQICMIDENGFQEFWETIFYSAVRSPPFFLDYSAGNVTRKYAAVYPKSFFGELWLLDEKGKAFPGFPKPVSEGSGIGFGSPVVFAHNESIYTAFICQNGELIVYDENAEVVPPFPLYLEGVFYLQPVFDGEFLWLVSEQGNLFRIDIDGETLFQNIPGLTVKEEGYLTFFDCNGDGAPEIFITGEGNALYAFTRSFRSLEGFPLPVWGKIHFTDAKDSVSRKPEITGMGMDRQLYRWQFK